ncbi:MAG: IS30 family transposase [Phreatobacter sp.]
MSRDQRDLIDAGLTEDREMSWTELGRRTALCRTTVMREVTGCGGRHGYSAVRADDAAAKRAKRPRGRVLGEPGPLRDRVTAELRAHRSPAAIAADLRADGGEGVCAETIYASVYDRTLEVKPSECLRRKRARRRRRQERHANKRPALPNISLRPAAVNDRAEVGHFEMDLIIGAHNRSALLTAQERLTRYLWLVTLPEGYLAESVLAAQSELFSQVSAHLLGSVTFDQGSEWAEWETLAATFGLKAWFCDPHSPWQRGAIENTNGHLRHWFPRGTELAGLDPAETDGVAHLLNGQRRRSLGWESAEQRWIAAGGVPLCSPSVTRSNGLIIAA